MCHKWNGTIWNTKYCFSSDKVSPYPNLSFLGVGVVSFLRKITQFENFLFVDYLPFVVHIPVTFLGGDVTICTYPLPLMSFFITNVGYPW